jgi:hypothetical protein
MEATREIRRQISHNKWPPSEVILVPRNSEMFSILLVFALINFPQVVFIHTDYARWLNIAKFVRCKEEIRGPFAKFVDSPYYS